MQFVAETGLAVAVMIVLAVPTLRTRRVVGHLFRFRDEREEGGSHSDDESSPPDRVRQPGNHQKSPEPVPIPQGSGVAGNLMHGARLSRSRSAGARDQSDIRRLRAKARRRYGRLMNQRDSKLVLGIAIGAVLLVALGVAALAVFASGWGMQFT